ncbi:tetraacyldisaccharide 4'-kinase [Prosthecochloris sp. ZM_2]|uniref:tetraacyldisaccharide 4'-kinase n=1 Tax=Prosthecochloris sp. ZM_2 TaxID=2045206 RepID=UPI001F34A9CD|nr:tetraacyldisaccharide 4'-kinase [Prosthecochloris sp. ZM_2]
MKSSSLPHTPLPDLLQKLLAPAASIYGMIMTARNKLFDAGILRSETVPLPVISVGNITAGGTGKSPMIDLFTKYVLSQGITPAIISRGYGRTTRGVRLVSDGRSLLLDSREAGDETVMLARQNPEAIVVVAERRTAGARFLMEHFRHNLPGVILLDDAFQHRRIQRDLDIVLINAREPFWKNRMLPAGRLREPVKGIRRADLVIINKLDREHDGRDIEGPLAAWGIPTAKARIRTGELVWAGGEAGNNRRFLAFAGIAGPESFLASLRHHGLDIAETVWFRDHEPCTAASIRYIMKKARLHSLALVTTEKDFIRLKATPELLDELTTLPLSYLPIEPEFFPGSRTLVESMIDRAISSTPQTDTTP